MASKAKKPSNAGTRWSSVEDVQLCKSWRAASHNEKKGKDRSKDDLWDEVHEHFSENWLRNPSDIRTCQAMTNRFKVLKKELLIWHGCLRKAKKWYKSGANKIDEVRQAQIYYTSEMKEKNMGSKEFNHWDAYEVVKGFQQFQDIPDNILEESDQTPSQEKIYGKLNFDKDAGLADVTPDPTVRPKGKKAAKEELRKGKKHMHDPERMVLAVETMAVNQASFAAQREKREQEYQRQLQFEHERECRKEHMEMRKEALILEERALKVKEREERIMEMNTSEMTPNRKKYWQKKQKKIAEKVDDEDAIGGSYPYPHFSGGSYSMPPFTGGAYSMPYFTGGANPTPPFVGGSYPQPSATEDDNTDPVNDSTNSDLSKTQWFTP